MKYIRIIVVVLLVSSCNNSNGPDHDKDVEPAYVGLPAPQNIAYTILAQRPHDTSAYTQGLQVHNGQLYESTGDYENSSLRITDWKTGKVEKIHPMGSNKIFGEGITILRNRIYQLTWQSNLAYVYEITNIEKPLATFKWPYEGWGITNNGIELIISDGSSNLYFVNPDDFRVRSTIAVVTNEGPVDNLNELEFINGFVYANVYQTGDIVKIEPGSGHVVGKMTFNNLLSQNEMVPGRTDVLNGIAYDSSSNTILITGKRWPKLFEVRLN